MTHTYSHGCFKLIFRKCHPHTHPLPFVSQAQAETPTHEHSLSRLPAFSCFRRMILQYPFLFLFVSISQIRILFRSYFLSIFSYPFSSTSSFSFFTSSSYTFLFILSHHLHFSFSSLLFLIVSFVFSSTSLFFKILPLIHILECYINILMK